MEIIGSKRSYALTWCMPNNDDDDDDVSDICLAVCYMYKLLFVVNVQWSEFFRLLLIVITISYYLIKCLCLYFLQVCLLDR